MINPNVRMAARVSGELNKLREAVGPSSAARARLTGRIAPVKKADDLSAFLDGGADEFEADAEKLN